MSPAFLSSEWNNRGSSFATNNWRMQVCSVERPTGFRKTQVEVNRTVDSSLSKILQPKYSGNR